MNRWTTWRVTEHLRPMLRTLRWVLPQFLPVETALDAHKDGSGEVRLKGVRIA